MRITVTGSTGHVGGNLVRALLAEGHQVRAQYIGTDRPLEGLSLERLPVDILDREGLSRAFEGQETVFHLASKITIAGDPDGSVHRINVDGVRNVCDACLEAGVRRLVHFSSIHAIQHNPWDFPLDENRPLADEAPGPCLVYDRSKAGGERVLREYVEKGLDAVVVSPTAILGPTDHEPSRMGAVILLLAQRRMPGLIDAGFDWVDVRDVCQGAIAAARSGRTGEKYVLSGSWRSFAELAQLVSREAGVRAPRFVSPVWLSKLGTPLGWLWARIASTQPLFTSESIETLSTSHRDIRHDKAAKELGYSPRSLEETVADTIRWFRESGRLLPAGT